MDRAKGDFVIGTAEPRGPVPGTEETCEALPSGLGTERTFVNPLGARRHPCFFQRIEISLPALVDIAGGAGAQQQPDPPMPELQQQARRRLGPGKIVHPHHRHPKVAHSGLRRQHGLGDHKRPPVAVQFLQIFEQQWLGQVDDAGGIHAQVLHGLAKARAGLPVQGADLHAPPARRRRVQRARQKPAVKLGKENVFIQRHHDRQGGIDPPAQHAGPGIGGEILLLRQIEDDFAGFRTHQMSRFRSQRPRDGRGGHAETLCDLHNAHPGWPRGGGSDGHGVLKSVHILKGRERRRQAFPPDSPLRMVLVIQFGIANICIRISIRAQPPRGRHYQAITPAFHRPIAPAPA